MEVTDDKIKRVEIAIPSNKNTEPIFEELRKDIKDIFDGYTHIKSSDGGGLYVDKEGNEHRENSNLFIIYYNPKKILEADEALKLLAKMLIDAGEKESWIISHDADRTICKKKKKDK